MTTTSATWAVAYGDEAAATRNEILRSVVGSGVHGIAIEGTDDHDEMGIYVSPIEHLLGVRTYRDDFIARTQPEGARSGPGDVDLVIYSLRKYLRLAMKGNPTALLPLYAPESDLIVATDLGWELRAFRDWFLSDHAIERFLGHEIASMGTLEVDRAEVSAEIEHLSGIVRRLLDSGRTAVRPEPAYDAIERWSVDVHRRVWAQ